MKIYCNRDNRNIRWDSFVGKPIWVKVSMIHPQFPYLCESYIRIFDKNGFNSINFGGELSYTEFYIFNEIYAVHIEQPEGGYYNKSIIDQILTKRKKLSVREFNHTFKLVIPVESYTEEEIIDILYVDQEREYL